MTSYYVFLEAGDVIKPGDQIYLDGWEDVSHAAGQKWNHHMHTVRRKVQVPAKKTKRKAK